MQIKKILKLIVIFFIISFSICDAETKQGISFIFKNKKLATIVNDLASKKKINIIYPQKAIDIQDFNKQEITYNPRDKEPVTLDRAWDLLTFFLDLSGYSWFEKNKNLWEIIPSGQKDQAGISREPLPTYIGTDPDDLPITQDRIRYVYYLSNLNVALPEKNPINLIIKDMSSESASAPIYLPQSDGFILIDKANVIASIINLISKLDELGFRENIEILPLFNVGAKEIAANLNILKLAAGNESTSIRNDPKNNLLTYFGTDTQIIPDLRQNTIILMGSEFNINRIKDFIHNYMDVPSESGKSILHSYDLQYLNAQEFAPILQKVVSNQIQSSQSSQTISYGPERFFQGVIVKAEELIEIKPTQGDTSTPASVYQKDSNFEPKGIQGQIYVGGNRLIVGALEDDWTYIKEFIKKMDIPQPQVILEVTIVDFETDKLNRLAGTSRSLTQIGPNNGQQFLASNITPVVNVLGPNPQQLAQDLLGVIGPQGLTSNVAPGSALISFNDPSTPGIWAILQLLDQYVISKIQSTPFIVCSNNQKGTLSQVLKQRARGDLIPTDNGSYQIPIEEVTATINLDLVPHIASDRKVKLDVAVRIESFIANTLTRLTRGINTTATIANNQILAMGGLAREDHNDTWTGTPIFKKIPIIGLLFRGEQYETIYNNIVIFIAATIVMPKAAATAIITEEKFMDSVNDLNYTYNFLNERDPITRLFFKKDQLPNDIIEDFSDLTSKVTEINLKKENYNGYFIPKPKNKKILKRKTNGLINILKNEKNPIFTPQVKT